MRSFLSRLPIVALLVGACTFANLSPASADLSGHHPAYIHGLHDLRVAHRFLDHPGNAHVDQQEVAALRDIDAAYRFALGAAETDQKDIHTYEPIDANLHHRDRLVRALAALHAAHRDFVQYESNGYAEGWRHDAIIAVDHAIRHTERAIRDQRWDQGY